MGMFDYLYYDGKEYQSKDTPAQLCDRYKIEREQVSGRMYLWHEAYKAEWIRNEKTISGYELKTSDHHWVHCNDFDGVINFYRQDRPIEAWVEYKALFMNGVALKLEKVSDE